MSVVKFEETKPLETYVKLKPLTDEQASKGYYQSINEGGSIEGYLRGTRLSTGKYAGKLEYVIESLDGSKTWVIANAGNLKASITRKGIEIGDALRITYRGKQVAKTGPFAGTAMHNFSVVGEAGEE